MSHDFTWETGLALYPTRLLANDVDSRYSIFRTPWEPPNDSLNDITLGSLKPWPIQGGPLILGRTFGVYTPLGFCTPFGAYTPISFYTPLGFYTVLGVYTLLGFCTLLGFYTIFGEPTAACSLGTAQSATAYLPTYSAASPQYWWEEAVQEVCQTSNPDAVNNALRLFPAPSNAIALLSKRGER